MLNFTPYNFLSLSRGVLFFVFVFIINTLTAQVIVPFTQRPSVEDPSRLIYTIKGDFTMIGNSNMVNENYSNNNDNGNLNMIYVDIDNDVNTLNSSSATLNFSTENSANPECSEILFAGLYWTGRAHDPGPSPTTFSVTKNVVGPLTVNENLTIGHSQSVTHTSYTMNVSRQGSSSNYFPRYTFTSSTGGSSVEFEFLNTVPHVRYRINGGAWIVPGGQVVTNSGNTRTVSFNPFTISDPNGVVITFNSIVRDSRTDRTQAQYRSTSFVNLNVSGTYNTTQSITKNYDKRVVSIKGPNSTNYTQITASNTNIYYPTTTEGLMYSGFAEITDYVRLNGVGEYFVADIAAREGNGGGTGFYAGWGMVVVYENPRMNWREVTIFDGHSFVQGSVTANFDIPISGFEASPFGDIEVKLGVMAGEGDRNIAGDFLEVRRFSDGVFQRLSHAGNSTTNFFNASVFTGGNARNPNNLNNYGMDVSFFNVPNPGNQVFGNNQTDTRFRYGTTQDSYIIFNFALSLSAYVPEVEGILTVDSINGAPVANPPQPVLPGENIVYTLEVRNNGTEPVNNTVYTFPLPYSASYVPGSISTDIFFTPAPTPNNAYFDPNLGPNGSIIWDFGTLPLPTLPNQLLGTLTFSLEAFADCYLLTNPQCVNNVSVPGFVSGVASITGEVIDNQPLIQGYEISGTCLDNPIFLPLVIDIDAADYVDTCAINSPVLNGFVFLENLGDLSPSDIGGNFMPGTRFYSAYPVISSTIEFTNLNPFPAIVGTTTYYAVAPGAAPDCFYVFNITFKNIIANDDIAGPINGYTGANNVLNIFSNDTLNNAPLNPTNVVLNVIEPDTTGVLTLLPNGVVNVAPSTPAGTYTFQYQICEIAFPSNCDTALVSVTVAPAPLVATNDNAGPINGLDGGNNIINVLINDSLNGQPVVPTDITLAPVTNGPLTVNANGSVDVAPNTPAGTYTVTYTICENLNPTNCDNAIVTVTVVPAVISAANDLLNCVDGQLGNTSLLNILSNDVLNGVTPNISDVTLSVLTPDINNRITLDVLTGIVSLQPQTQEGVYTIVYRLCENLNPLNCSDATVRISVSPFIYFSATPPTDCLVDDGLIEIENLLNGVTYTLSVNSINSVITILGFSYLLGGLVLGVYNINVINQSTNCILNNLLIDLLILSIFVVFL